MAIARQAGLPAFGEIIDAGNLFVAGIADKDRHGAVWHARKITLIKSGGHKKR